MQSEIQQRFLQRDEPFCGRVFEKISIECEFKNCPESVENFDTLLLYIKKRKEKIPKFMKVSQIRYLAPAKECRPRDLNPHGIATNGF